MSSHDIHAPPRLLVIIAVAVAITLAAAPIVYLVITALKPASLLFANPPRFVFEPTYAHFARVFSDAATMRSLMNSVVVSVLATVVATLLGAWAAFVLALLNFRLKRFWFFVIVATRIFPPVTTLIPIYVIMRYLGLIDTYPALVLPYSGTQLALAVWIMWSYYKDLPHETFEAAILDGCNAWQLFWRVALPMSYSGIAACAVIVFILNWNEFLFALALTSTEARTGPVALMAFMEQEGLVQWGVIAALGTVMITPVIIMVLFLRNYLIQGMTAGATKG